MFNVMTSFQLARSSTDNASEATCVPNHLGSDAQFTEIISTAVSQVAAL